MGGGSSSSSSSSSGKAGKKKAKKAKKEKKAKKGAKKADKREEKEAKNRKQQEQREERAKLWDCDRREAVRLIKGLMQLDAGVASELEGVFQAIDSGETVRIDGLEDKQAKKKLRHLMQALRLTPVEAGFKRPDKKVSFLALFRLCLADAGGKAPESAAAAAKQAPVAAPVREAAAASPATATAEAEAEVAQGAGAETDGPAPARPRKVGPQLPGACVGPAVGGGESGSEDEEGDDAKDREAGPRLAGAERKGVDLDLMDDEGSRREEWMNMPHAALAGAFADGPGQIKGERYEVKRSKEEQEAFEKMVAGRGPSLLQQAKEGAFAAHAEEQDRMRKRKHNSHDDLWGASAKDQERGGRLPAAVPAPRKAFDPEQDMRQTKPINGDDFAKLVENSAGALGGRFSRGHVATSFL